MSLRRFALALVVASAAPCIAEAQGGTTPCDLIQQPATRIRSDSIPGVGRVSFVGGAVLIKCPQRGITLRGDSAEMFPDHDQMIGHSVYDEPRFHVTADYLNYFPMDERVVGVGNVHARLPSGSTLDGPQAEYKRVAPRIRTRPQMSAIARPTVSIVQKDSAGKLQPPMKVVANTILVDGDSSDAQIYAGGQVTIDRDSVSAAADSAHIDQPKETMHLMRNPVLRGKKGKPFTLNGDLIDLYSSNKKLNRIISRANAKAVSDSMTLTADTIDLRVVADLLDHAFAWGALQRAHVVSPSQNMLADSLDVTMPAQRIRLVRAFRKALAQGKPDTVRFTIEKPDTTDWLQGDTIVAHFDTLATKDTASNPDIRKLVAAGHASSLYHMAASDSSERRPALNHVTARAITIDFDQRKVATVTTVDSVSGVYIEPRPDSTSKKRTGTNTPTQQPAPKPGQKPAPTSVVPIPTKPPTKPPTSP